MDVEKIAKKARKSISKFCSEECRSYCCRKGYLVLTSSQADLVTQKKKKDYEDKKLLKGIKEGRYSLYIGNKDFPCPSLKDFKCLIHRNRNRPDACKQFPIFVHGNTIKLSSRCPAVIGNLFYPYIKKFIAAGCKIVESTQLYDADIYITNPTNKA